MTSALNTKINSYTLNRGIEFDQAFTLTPTRTGTNPLGSFAQNSLGGTVYEPTVGPAGGSGSWKFVLSNVANTNSYINCISNVNITEAVGMSDGDWSVGIWFNLAQLPIGSAAPMTIMNASPNTTFGYAIGVSGNVLGADSGKISFTPNAGVVAYGPVVTTNTWHYVAIVKTGTSASFYYDGAFVGSRTGLSAGGAITQIRHGSNGYTGTNATTMNLSNFYLTSSSVIGATQIAEIWAVGTPVTGRTVKYYDGTSWQTSAAQKVWNGTAWVDWNVVKRWDGSAWIDI
jgi:hypothetical protein